MPAIACVGELVSWKAKETTIAQVRAGLTAAGLDADLAKDMAPRNAFSRAATKLQEERSIDKVNEDGDVLQFQFTAMFLEKSAHQMHFRREATVTLHKRSGYLVSDDPAIEHLARTQMSLEMDRRTANDVTRIVQKVFETHSGDLIAIREQGGVYFVPERLSHIVDKCSAFLVAVGGQMMRFAIAPGDPNTDNAVAQSINQHFETLLGDFDKLCGSISLETSDEVAYRRREQIQVLRGKLNAYRALMSDYADKIGEGISLAEDRLIKRLNGEEVEEKPVAVPVQPTLQITSDDLDAVLQSVLGSGFRG